VSILRGLVDSQFQYLLHRAPTHSHITLGSSPVPSPPGDLNPLTVRPPVVNKGEIPSVRLAATSGCTFKVAPAPLPTATTPAGGIVVAKLTGGKFPSLASQTRTRDLGHRRGFRRRHILHRIEIADAGESQRHHHAVLTTRAGCCDAALGATRIKECHRHPGLDSLCPPALARRNLLIRPPNTLTWGSK